MELRSGGVGRTFQADGRVRRKVPKAQQQDLLQDLKAVRGRVSLEAKYITHLQGCFQNKELRQ